MEQVRDGETLKGALEAKTRWKERGQSRNDFKRNLKVNSSGPRRNGSYTLSLKLSSALEGKSQTKTIFAKCKYLRKK